tara:strand:- start:7 stop:504 length:498 start_codon:yes stop_codon:yes gene_type:complete
MDLENFQTIIDFPNYMINENGNIYSKHKNKILKSRLTNNGYITLVLRKDKKSIHKNIHRLLGLQYLPNPDNKPCVDHINRNKIDNSLSNLRWVTYYENAKNKSSKKNSSSRFVGVRKTDNKKNPYRVETTHLGKKFHIGYYETEEEAHEAYKEFNKEHFNFDIFD